LKKILRNSTRKPIRRRPVTSKTQGPHNKTPGRKKEKPTRERKYSGKASKWEGKSGQEWKGEFPLGGKKNATKEAQDLIKA